MSEVLFKMDLGENLKAWTAITENMRTRIEDLSPVFEAGDRWFRAEMDEQFKTQGAFLQGGTEWTPLSPEYAKRKPQPPSPFGILYRSGDLYRSLANEGSDHIKIISKQEGVYGSSVHYGSYHQTGAEHQKATGRSFFGDNTIRLPQRKIIILLNKMRERFIRASYAHILSGKSPGAE